VQTLLEPLQLILRLVDMRADALLDRRVVATYGPTADVTWSGADPTLNVEAASRGSLPDAATD